MDAMKAMDPALALEMATVTKHSIINETIQKGDSDIQKFYAGTTLFITGGSGFVGKHLIEKLFRSCDIKKLFILLRPKKKFTIHERLAAIVGDPLFDTVQKLKPDFADKIYPVEGDVSEPRLLLKDEQYKLIVEETEVIIHAAATISFDEPLKKATLTNVRGTMEMLQLARTCRKLKAVVHVSTAYSNCTKDRIEKDVVEQFYQPPIAPRAMVEMAETMSEELLNQITPELINNWPNTYTFTKAIAEEAVRQAQNELPICILRPAIVICSVREPIPGWLDESSAHGPSGLIIGCGMGILHAYLAHPKTTIDLMPVDLVNNAIIAAGWMTSKKTPEEDAKIYTVTNARNQILFGDMIHFFITTTLSDYPTPKMIWHCFFVYTNCKYYYWLLCWLWHMIPAYVIDVGLRIARKRPVAVKLYKRIAKLTYVLSYFVSNNWKQSDQNLQILASSLSPADKVIFQVDIASVDWEELLCIWIIGMRKYILKDGLQGTEVAKKKVKRFKIAHYLFCIVYFFIIYKILSWSFSLTTTALSYIF